jgi:hypothetical protein
MVPYMRGDYGLVRSKFKHKVCVEGQGGDVRTRGVRITNVGRVGKRGEWDVDEVRCKARAKCVRYLTGGDSWDLYWDWRWKWSVCLSVSLGCCTKKGGATGSAFF